MARRSNKPVDEFRDNKFNLKVIIYLTPENTFATSEVFGKVFISDTAEDCTRQARAFLRDAIDVTFMPVIEIKKLEPFALRTGSFVGLDAHRFYYGRTPAGNFLSASWDSAERYSNKELINFSKHWNPLAYTQLTEFSPPAEIKGDYYLPYTEETWAGLVKLMTIIDAAKEKLDEILQSPDGGAARFEAAGSILMLGKGE